MVEHRNNNKKLIISHIADVDGLSGLILAKLHYENIDYCLVEFHELEVLLKKLVADDSYKQYDEIFITDVSFRPSTLDFVNSNEELKKRIRHFDHHMSERNVMEKYPFVNEVEYRDGKKVCGATLFYDHIKDSFKYKSEYLDKYLEAVRCYDNGGPLCGNQYGVDLTTLATVIGRDNFVDKMCEGIKNGRDPITEQDWRLIRQEYQKKKEYIELCDKNLVRIELNGLNVGVSYSEEYRSDVGNALSLKYKDELDYILIANFMRNSFSFRTVRDDVNVAEVAKSITPEGGGNAKAGGMPMNENTFFIFDLVNEARKKKEAQRIMKLPSEDKKQS